MRLMRRTIFTSLLLIVFAVGCNTKPESSKPASAETSPETSPVIEPAQHTKSEPAQEDAKKSSIVKPTPTPIRTPRIQQISRREYERRLNEQLPKDVRKFLEQADNFELLSVSGVAMGRPAPDEELISAGRFGVATVRGTARITDERIRKDLLQAFYDSLVHPGYQAACFAPAHAIRATSEGKSVELTICFHCSNFFGSAFGEQQLSGTISKAPQKLFNRVLKSAGVRPN